MKEYIKSRILMSFEAVIICSLLLLLNKGSYEKSSLSIALNDTIDKSVDKDVIQKTQNTLYQEEIQNPLYTFIGELTGYTGDCPLCTGYLACPPRTNVIKEGIYFNDKKYGKVRIVASSKKYQCGTILKFNVGKLSDEPMIAIVLDRGVSGNVIDLLTDSKDYAVKKVGRVRNLEFEVLREGWK